MFALILTINIFIFAILLTTTKHAKRIVFFCKILLKLLVLMVKLFVCYLKIWLNKLFLYLKHKFKTFKNGDSINGDSINVESNVDNSEAPVKPKPQLDVPRKIMRRPVPL